MSKIATFPREVVSQAVLACKDMLTVNRTDTNTESGQPAAVWSVAGEIGIELPFVVQVGTNHTAVNSTLDICARTRGEEGFSPCTAAWMPPWRHAITRYTRLCHAMSVTKK